MEKPTPQEDPPDHLNRAAFEYLALPDDEGARAFALASGFVPQGAALVRPLRKRGD